MSNEVHILPDGRMNTKSAVSYTGFSYRTLANYRTKGNGPKFIKLGVVWYYKKDLDDWLESTKSRSTAECRLKQAQRVAA